MLGLVPLGGCLSNDGTTNGESSANGESAGDGASGAPDGTTEFEHEVPRMDPERMRGVHGSVVDDVPDGATVTEAAGTCLEDDDVLQRLFEHARAGETYTATESGYEREAVAIGTGQAVRETDEATKEELYRAAGCLHHAAEFSNTAQEYADGVYVRDDDVVLALGYSGVD